MTPDLHLIMKIALLIMKAIGPRAEPWITLAEMECGLDIVPLNLVWWERPLKKRTSQV